MKQAPRQQRLLSSAHQPNQRHRAKYFFLPLLSRILAIALLSLDSTSIVQIVQQLQNFITSSCFSSLRPRLFSRLAPWSSQAYPCIFGEALSNSYSLSLSESPMEVVNYYGNFKLRNERQKCF